MEESEVKQNKGLTNRDIVVYALFLSGGISRYVHTEEIALKCMELAPRSFSWVKYQDLPDKEIARRTLINLAQEKFGAMVHGRAGTGRGRNPKISNRKSLDGWKLTEAGIQWVKQNENLLHNRLKQREPRTERQEVLQKLSRLRNHVLFKDFQHQPEGFVPAVGLLADLMRCRVDADRVIWEKRFTTLRNHAQLADQDDVLVFLDICQRFVNSELRS